MNYTEKYHLPQWKKEDRIMMEDFNRMCANLEEGLARAQGTADGAYAPGNSPHAIGTYVGNGTTTVIELGFRPRFVILTAQNPTNSSVNITYVAIAGMNIDISGLITFRDTGFSVKTLTHEDGYVSINPQMNLNNKIYAYIAFR